MTALIGVISCRRQLGLYSYHVAGDKYVEAATYVGLPLVLPALNEPRDLNELLSKLDGILFTGSPSNVLPQYYQGSASVAGTLHDPLRDKFTLPLIKLAITFGVPILAICRGFQELNVAFGGSLHQRLDEISNMLAHKEPETADLNIKYALRHEVAVQKGGLLAKLNLPAKFMVNSLHNQGIERLGDNLQVEAIAPDGLIEAVTVKNAKSFNLGVQWHPEWQLQENPQSLAIFNAFKDACHNYANKKA